jgi:hypothetical protein
LGVNTVTGDGLAQALARVNGAVSPINRFTN